MPKVIYWTTACLEPEIEAISKEVIDLAGHFGSSWVVSVSPHVRFRISIAQRYVAFHPGFYPLLRLVVPAMELRCDINHIYAEVAPWLYVKTLGTRPTVLTIASEKGEHVPAFVDRCDSIVVQTEGMRQRLLASGVARRKVRLIYPGVDLSAFCPVISRKIRHRVRILFATFPREARELDGRGVLLLLDLASCLPDVEFVVVSRPWRTGGTALSVVKAILEARGLANVRLVEGIQMSMSGLYHECDFTVIPYTREDGGKECPLSLVESLACGTPVLVSAVASFSGFVREHNCGLIFDARTETFSQALSEGLRNHSVLRINAAKAARTNFDRLGNWRAYAKIYEAVGSLRRSSFRSAGGQ